MVLKIHFHVFKITPTVSGQYKMDFRKLLTYILLVKCGCVCQFNVTLDADKSTVLEYSNVSLTCSRQFKNGLPVAVFVNSTDNFFSRISVSLTDNSCQSGILSSPWPTYSFQCFNDSAFMLTVINVTNELHGKNWRCWQRDNASLNHNSSLIYLFVQVPVRSVNISLLVGNWTHRQSYIQGETVSMKCVTSLGRPQPNVTWFVGESYENATEIILRQSQYRYVNQSETLNYTISIITLNMSRAFHQKKIFCNTTNVPELEPVSSDFTLINVKYPPNVRQMQNESIIEGQNLSKTCLFDYGNPAETSVLWINADDFPLSTSKHLLLLNVSRINAICYRCLANNTMIYSNGTTVFGTDIKAFYMNVLYRPENFTVNLSMDSGMPFSITQNFSIIENFYLVFNCSATGNPEPRLFSWTGMKANYSNVLQFNATRNFTGHVTCHANNTMESTIGHGSKTYGLEILYPPELEALTTSKVIEGEDFTKTCRTTSGKTSKQTVMWTWDNATAGINSTHLNFTKITRNKTANYVCEVIYEMVPTYGENRTGRNNTSFHLDVMYKPEKVALRLNINKERQFNVTRNFSIIENTFVTFYCSAQGNPEPKHFSWSGFGIHSSNSESLELNATRQFAGPITCHAKNIMEHSNGTNITGQGSVTYGMTVLYPPTIEIKHEGSILEGGNATISCTSISGKTTNSTMFWTLSNGTRIEGTSVAINSLTSNDMGNYTCEINYTMVPTYGVAVKKSLYQTFYLDVHVSKPIDYNNADKQPSSVGPAIGGSIGGVMAVLIIVFSVFIIKRRIEKKPKVVKQHPEYQNMNFMEENKQKKRLPPIPPEDVPVSEKQHQVHHVEVSDDHTHPNTSELDMQSKPKEVKPNPEYQNLNLIEDIKQHKHVPPVPTENGRKEHHTHNFDALENHQDSTTLKTQKKPKEIKQHSEYENMNLTKDVIRHTRLPPMIPTEDAYEVPDRVYHVDIFGDENQVELLEIIHTISLSDLFSYVTSKSAEDYFQEYARFPQGMISTIPYTFSRRPQNAPLNRYQGIYPYDHSRVVIPGEPDFFINANYIDGHSKQKAYIASLGPTVRHCLGFQTFWKMVWHEKSDVIVMLTNLQEPSGMKCEKYWADYGTTRDVGDFNIQSVTEEIASEYTVRTFNVSKKGESRLVTQLHFTAWPDKKVPEDVTSLIEFWQRVKDAPTRSLGPLVVHCSAGIGRTGTYIALDRLFEEGKSTNSVNVFDCVMSMRQQRVNMVQTQDQYVYLHQALVYCLVFDTEPVAADTIEEYVKTTSHNVYIKLFEQLKQSVELESTYEAEARTRNCDDDERNRTQADIPGDAHRIRLFLDKGSDESDYINAVYLNSFKRLDHFIIAQSPLPNTLDDFVSMLYQENCCCIVSLDDYQQNGTNNAAYLPAENQHATFGSCTISSTMLDSKSAYSVRKLKIGHSSRYEKGMKIAHHFEYTGWKHDERIPKDVNMFVEFVQEVEEYATQLADEHSHVLVHCLTGSGRSGLFCAVSNLIQKMGQDRQVSVVNTLRQVRARRKTAIRNTEQLKLCYQAVYAFVKNYKV